MGLQLEAIKFNHNPAQAANDGLNIRRNHEDFLTVPEWRRGASIVPEDSLAAYAIEETRNNTLTIQARFSCTDPTIEAAEIRAIDRRYRYQGCLYEIFRRIRWIITPPVDVFPPLMNVLGEVEARQVQFATPPVGDTGFQIFRLHSGNLWRFGVGIHDVEWVWQYRLNSTDQWTDLATTHHRIYSVLETPKLPWKQTPYDAANTQLPWSEVLDYACHWARRASTSDVAACRVTQSIYNLGQAVVEYDCPGGGHTNYAYPDFDCTAFLERLKGGIGNGQYVNCSDCATFVSTFANILGCDLWQSRMGYSFGLNPVLSIGSDVWQNPCNWESFNYHEVAWKDSCSTDDGVFDACLMVDGDKDPTAAPHSPMFVCNMRFGKTGDGDYRDRLASPNGRQSCNPQPGTRKRREVV